MADIDSASAGADAGIEGVQSTTCSKNTAIAGCQRQVHPVGIPDREISSPNSGAVLSGDNAFVATMVR